MALFFRNGIIALIRPLFHDGGVDTHGKLSPEGLNQAIASERKSFETYYRWLEESMPPLFFEEFTPEQMIALVHSLMGFSVQRYFAEIHFKDVSVVLCLEEINADLRILKNYTRMGIRSYQTFVSHGHIPLINKPLRVAILKFTQALVSASPERQKRIQELATMAQKK